MRRKIFSILAVLAVLGICSMLMNEMTQKDNTTDGSDSGYGATPDDTDGESDGEETDFYTYADIELRMKYLARDAKQEAELVKLIDPLEKSKQISLSYIKTVVEMIGAPVDVYSKDIANRDSDVPLNREQFDKIYENIVISGAVEDLVRRDVFVFDIRSEISQEGNASNYLYDGAEEYYLAIELPDECLDSLISVYEKNNEIFYMLGPSYSQARIDNVWILSVENGYGSFLYDGIYKRYPVSVAATENDALFEHEGHCVANLICDNSGIIGIEFPETVKAHISEADDNGFMADDIGKLNCADNFKIYCDVGSVTEETSLVHLTYFDELELIYEDNEALAVIVREELPSEDIRVILCNNDYSSYDLESVTITCDTDFEITYPDENKSVKSAGGKFTIDYKNYNKGDKLVLEPKAESGRLKILSLERDYGNPVYRGKLEVLILEEAVRVINILPMEQYLYSVVSSEIAATAPAEAIKAMAVCARGYAYEKQEDKIFDSYDADLDDSSLCQVYNNAEENSAAIVAVRETYGMVAKYDGDMILPLYFSTSFGMTCTNKEIWGGTAYDYLESNVENINKDELDLSEEDSFIEFMNDCMGYDILDKDMPYFRWDIAFTRAEISEAINSMLEERMNATVGYIKVKNDSGKFKVEEIDDIGEVISITVAERSESGVVQMLEIEGTLATIRVTGQSNIRNLITPVNQTIVRHDGTNVTGWTSLPSPYYYLEETSEGYIIHGGGFGHGVGMSQNGAAVLAENGKDYKYILEHYFTDIEIESIYEDDSEEE